MRRFANTLSFALAFAIPAWAAAVAYPFAQGPAAAPHLDPNSAFRLFCLYAFIAGAFGGAIYAATLAYRNRSSSMIRSVFSGVITLVVCLLSALLLAFLYGTESQSLRGFVLITALTACAFACARCIRGENRS